MPEKPKQDRKGLTPAERELELALVRLRPSPARLDRDRLIFEAGRLAERRRSRRWMAAAAMLGLCALLTAVFHPGVRVREQVVYRDRPVEVVVQADPPPPATAAADGRVAEGVSYRDLRAAMAEDVDADLSDVHTNVRRADRRGLPTFFLGLFNSQTSKERDGK